MDMDLEDERLTELPQRFETSNTNFIASPITVNVTQVAVPPSWPTQRQLSTPGRRRSAGRCRRPQYLGPRSPHPGSRSLQSY